MVIELRALSYEDKLKKLGLTTLEVRWKRCDLNQIYKIKNGIEEVDIDIEGGNQGVTKGGDMTNKLPGKSWEMYT